MRSRPVPAVSAAASTLVPALALLASAPVHAEAPALASEATAAAAPEPAYRLGAYADVDAGLMVALKQSAGLSGGAVWGPFRAGLSYATFLSNGAFGGVPDGFSMRVNYIIGFNAPTSSPGAPTTGSTSRRCFTSSSRA
jgi:hypothetical protein